jgi:hypothetical protein
MSTDHVRKGRPRPCPQGIRVTETAGVQARRCWSCAVVHQCIDIRFRPCLMATRPRPQGRPRPCPRDNVMRPQAPGTRCWSLSARVVYINVYRHFRFRTCFDVQISTVSQEHNHVTETAGRTRCWSSRAVWYISA